MKKLLTFLLVMICLQTMAQTTITQIPPGQIIKQQEAIKKAAEKQAAIDKVLNATLKQGFIIIRNYTRHAKYVFAKLSITLDGNKDSKFELYTDLAYRNPIMNANEDLFEFNGGPAYKDLLQNGFLFKANFSDRLPNSPIKKGNVWGCNFFISFLFTDGTKVEIPLQDFVAGNSRMWQSKDNLIGEKNIPGNAFPDPANPLVLAPVK
jgi:hypothetical protein